MENYLLIILVVAGVLTFSEILRMLWPDKRFRKGKKLYLKEGELLILEEGRGSQYITKSGYYVWDKKKSFYKMED